VPATARPSEPIFVVEGVVQRYRNVVALDGVSLALSPGVTALVGVNGAGKSTLMATMAGALRPAVGSLRVQGIDPYGRDRRLALRAVALMPQSATLPRRMTALDVVEYLAWMRGVPAKAARQAALGALDRVGLVARAHHRVGQLSGGMQRRVLLAQAIASDARVLLLDEPSTGLDPEQRRVMVELIRGLDVTVLMSSHVLEDVVDAAGRVVVLDDGRVVFEGTVEALSSLAPSGTDQGRAPEAGFLAVVAGARAARA
jgi:ABC-2 type transport system ATP-binding protein